jgi:LemA protein
VTTLATAVAALAAAALLTLAGWAALAYRLLRGRRTAVRAAWRRLDGRLRHRHGAVGHLVTALGGQGVTEHAAADHAAELHPDLAPDAVEAAVLARNAAMAALGLGPAHQAAAEAGLDETLARLLALPAVRAVADGEPAVAPLVAEVRRAGEEIVAERAAYNAAVEALNAAVQRGPGAVLAGVAGFRTEQFFAPAPAPAAVATP